MATFSKAKPASFSAAAKPRISAAKARKPKSEKGTAKQRAQRKAAMASGSIDAGAGFSIPD